MKLIEFFTDEVVTDEIKAFRQWVEEQRDAIHKFREGFFEKKMKDWEELDQFYRDRYDDTIPEDEWAIDFSDDIYNGEWYTPDRIKELEDKGINSYSEEYLNDFLNNECNWNGSKSLSYLLGVYVNACAGCGECDDDVSKEFTIEVEDWNFADDYEDFDLKEYEEGAY